MAAVVLTITACDCFQVVLQQADEGSDSDNDDLFAPKTSQGGGQADTNADAIDAPDNSRVDLDDALLAKWSEPGRTQQLRNRFVTGMGHQTHIQLTGRHTQYFGVSNSKNNGYDEQLALVVTLRLQNPYACVQCKPGVIQQCACYGGVISCPMSTHDNNIV